MLDPEGKNKDLQKAKNLLGGAGDLLASQKDIDYESEFAIGESLALEGFQRYGLPVKDKELQKYMSLIGRSVARNSSRPDIPYYFVAVNSPLYNAFACPGGIIFISSTLIKSMKNEAELACVIAHEISHVTHKHALNTIKRAKMFEGMGKISQATMKGKDSKKFQNVIGGLQDVLFEKGLDKNMEFEADLSGLDLAYKAGYNPKEFVRVLNMLKENEKNAEKKGSWYSTHPPLPERIKKCQDKLKSFPDAGTLAVLEGRFSKYQKRL
ncbi:MAG: M48 family metalloprotease [Proteobacteria bacterium]|nr:M48 family metalloprotease [Pseudomonadota bacterium]